MMIVYNVNPKDSKPIVIVTQWSAEPNGTGAVQERTIMLCPGDGIDLSLIGLEPKPSENGGGKSPCQVT